MSARGWLGGGRARTIIARAGAVVAAILGAICTALPASAVRLQPSGISDLPRIVLAADEGRALARAEESRALAAEGRMHEALAAAQEALALTKLEFGEEHAYVAFILGDLAEISFWLRDLEGAEDFGSRAVHIIGKAKPDSIEAARLEQNLGTIVAARGQYCRAKPLFEQAHATLRAQLGAEHERTGAAARELGIALLELSQPAQALPYFEQTMAAQSASAGKRSIAFARAGLDLASAEIALERSDDARRRARDARVILETADADPADLAAARILEAQAAIKQAALAEAEALLNQGLRDLRSGGAQDSPLVGQANYFLGLVNIQRGRFIEAEPLYKDALAAYRRAVGPRHPAVARIHHSLALVYQQIGRYDEAQQQYREAIDTFRDVRATEDVGSCGPDPAEAATLAERAVLYADRGNFTDAERDARDALSIYQKAEGDWRLRRGFALSALGRTLRKQQRLDEAEATVSRAVKLIETVRGPHSSDLPPGLNELALIALEQGDPAEAESQARRAVDIRRKDAAQTPWGFARAQTTLALAIAAQGRQAEALAEIREATDVMRSRLDLQGRQRELALGESLSEREVFERHIEIIYSLYAAGNLELIGEAIDTLQFPRLTSTATTLQRMAARFATGQGPLAELVQARERAIEAWTARDLRFLELERSSEAPPQDMAELRLQLANQDSKIRELDRELSVRFPQYAELVQPRPIPLSVLQKTLRPSEAILMQVTAAEATYLAFVTPANAWLSRTDIGGDELVNHVDRLRAALEVRPGRDFSTIHGFDVEGAHRLYQAVFEPFADRFKGLSTLFFVPDGALQNLTPAVLLMEPAPKEPAAYARFDDHVPELFEPLRQLRFLGLEVPIAVLPSAGSLQSLRQLDALPEAEGPFVGFAPLEWGDIQAPSDSTGRGPVAGNLSEDGISLDVRSLASKLPPLTEAKDELLEIAALLGADPSRVVLGPAASESAAKSLSPRAAQVVAFATHAVIKGEFGGIAEPALIMHLAEREQTDGEDGVLLASEVAQLPWQADWVILSACNTAASAGPPGAEGLSGLAKAFFHAGTRSLLVSHWWVNSEATVQLTTGAVRALREHPEWSRAQALRTSMWVMAKNPRSPAWSHPYFWAPFTIVGAAN